MRQRTRYFLVVLLLMFAGNIFAQINSNSGNYTYGKVANKFIIVDSLLPSNLYSVKFKKIIAVPPISYFRSFWGPSPPELKSSFNLLAPVAKDFSTMQLGVVCKKEFEFEKKTSIPLRLRIGSLDYTNYMEQKPNAPKPQ